MWQHCGGLCTDAHGFSLHAAVRCGADQRKQLEIDVDWRAGDARMRFGDFVRDRPTLFAIAAEQGKVYAFSGVSMGDRAADAAIRRR